MMIDGSLLEVVRYIQDTHVRKMDGIVEYMVEEVVGFEDYEQSREMVRDILEKLDAIGFIKFDRARLRFAYPNWVVYDDGRAEVEVWATRLNRKMLKWVRERFGNSLEIQKGESELGLSRSELDDIEKGNSIIRFEDLRVLAEEVYKVNLVVFFAEDVVEKSPEAADLFNMIEDFHDFINSNEGKMVAKSEVLKKVDELHESVHKFIEEQKE